MPGRQSASIGVPHAGQLCHGQQEILSPLLSCDHLETIPPVHVCPECRLGGVAAPPASLLLLEPLGVPGNPPLPNSFPLLHWEIRLRLAGLKWVWSPNLSISKCSFFRPPSPGLPWYSLSNIVPLFQSTDQGGLKA